MSYFRQDTADEKNLTEPFARLSSHLFIVFRFERFIQVIPYKHAYTETDDIMISN
jgi:hypothetical protein